MEGYENKIICSHCQGACCKRMPAPAMPEDFNGANLNSLIEAFKSGKWAIDWLDRAGLDEPTEDTRDKAYFIRPRIKEQLELFDISKKGECIFLTEIGCELALAKRPEGCRMLEPIESDKCLQHGPGVVIAAMAWMPFNEVIEDAAAFIDTDSNN
jgi:hypothetical protein